MHGYAMFFSNRLLNALPIPPRIEVVREQFGALKFSLAVFSLFKLCPPDSLRRWCQKKVAPKTNDDME